MKNKKNLYLGLICILAFVIWTILIQTIDVQPVGVNGTNIGFSTFNCWFHNLTGVSMLIYTITDYLGLVPILVCVLFAGVGFIQLVKRKSLFKVDKDIIFLGIHYALVILCYLIFEKIPINYRPILIEGAMEVSYPSSTTLLVLGVMPTLNYQVSRRLKNVGLKNVIVLCSSLFTVFMVVGRTIAGVHWATDIIGSIFLSLGLYSLYLASVKYKK